MNKAGSTLFNHSISLLLLLILLFPTISMAKQSNYKIIDSTTAPDASVKIRLVVYCKSKKLVEEEAKIAALRIVMFDGCPNTLYTKPIIDEEFSTSYQKHASYYDDLFSNRLDDFVSSIEMRSKFKKADKKKGTEFEVTIRASRLRKDLERNKIKMRFGL